MLFVMCAGLYFPNLGFPGAILCPLKVYFGDSVDAFLVLWVLFMKFMKKWKQCSRYSGSTVFGVSGTWFWWVLWGPCRLSLQKLIVECFSSLCMWLLQHLHRQHHPTAAEGVENGTPKSHQNQKKKQHVVYIQYRTGTAAAAPFWRIQHMLMLLQENGKCNGFGSACMSE